jgi:hypothetical protein
MTQIDVQRHLLEVVAMRRIERCPRSLSRKDGSTVHMTGAPVRLRASHS